MTDLKARFSATESSGKSKLMLMAKMNLKQSEATLRDELMTKKFKRIHHNFCIYYSFDIDHK